MLFPACVQRLEHLTILQNATFHCCRVYLIEPNVLSNGLYSLCQLNCKMLSSVLFHLVHVISGLDLPVRNISVSPLAADGNFAG